MASPGEIGRALVIGAIVLITVLFVSAIAIGVLGGTEGDGGIRKTPQINGTRLQLNMTNGTNYSLGQQHITSQLFVENDTISGTRYILPDDSTNFTAENESGYIYLSINCYGTSPTCLGFNASVWNITFNYTWWEWTHSYNITRQGEAGLTNWGTLIPAMMIIAAIIVVMAYIALIRLRP